MQYLRMYSWKKSITVEHVLGEVTQVITGMKESTKDFPETEISGRVLFEIYRTGSEKLT